jgi:hypothetical protein
MVLKTPDDIFWAAQKRFVLIRVVAILGKVWAQDVLPPGLFPKTVVQSIVLWLNG